MENYRIIHAWVTIKVTDKQECKGVVRTVGEGCVQCNPTCTVRPGDTVIFRENGYTEHEVNGETLLFIRADDIQAIINPTHIS